MSSILQGFSKSLAMTVLSEIGDKTFFAAAILAMRHPRRLVLSGCLAALIVMTALSVLVGWAAPNLISQKWAHHVTTLLFFGFGFWSLWDGFHDGGDAEELNEVEAKLDADINKANAGANKESDKAFSLTFFGEWGDKSQASLATIGLAADETHLIMGYFHTSVMQFVNGIVFSFLSGQALCTTAAVVGGKSLAAQISEKFVGLSGGVLFIIFGIQSFLSSVEP
ncbi:hypothetical protein BT93_D1877 [Corymbia citriodora subsp. variegata]|nr:hypothetical protein BT93_D1877 [Corymbia citriodora subsp. variegata]